MRRISPIPLAAVGVIALLALIVPWLGLPDPVRMDVAHRLTGPSAGHLLGQDDLGRDILSELLWGARSSLTVAILSAAVSCAVGTSLGVLGGSATLAGADASSDVLVTATVYNASGPTSTDTVTLAALQANPDQCPTYQGQSMRELGRLGQGKVSQLAQLSIPFSACLDLPRLPAQPF